MKRFFSFCRNCKFRTAKLRNECYDPLTFSLRYNEDLATEMLRVDLIKPSYLADYTPWCSFKQFFSFCDFSRIK